MESLELIERRIRYIDNRVKHLEQINDRYIISNGSYNEGIYNIIQELMDEREELFRKIRLVS